MDINREALAWAAGFFDGEGHVRRERGTNFCIAIPQVDRYVLDRFAAAVSVGRIYGPNRQKGNRRPQWRYQVSGHPRVQAVCAMLWPWLSPVKREQMTRALTGKTLLAHMKYRVRTCEHGVQRPLKHCGECRRDYNRTYYRGHTVQHLEQSRRQRRKPEFREAERQRNRVAMQRRRLIRKTAAALLVAS